MPFPSPALTHTIYVSKGGSDSNDGTPNLPVLTIAKALDLIGTSATPSSPWVVYFGPGEWNEPSVEIIPFVTYVGAGPIGIQTGAGDASVTKIHCSIGDAVTYWPEFNTSKWEFANAHFYFGNVDPTWANSPNGGIFYSTNAQLDMLAQKNGLSVYMSGGVSDITARNNGQYYFYNVALGGPVSDANAPEIFLTGCYGIGNGELVAGGSATVHLRDFIFAGTQLLNGTPTVNVYGGAISPSQIVIAGGTPVVSYFPLGYIPADAGDWAGTAPTTIAEAIDRLAAANPGA